MELEDDQFLQSAISDFARTLRSRTLQMVGLCLIIFAIGILVGMSIKYEAVEITVEVPATEVSEDLGGAKTTRT